MALSNKPNINTAVIVDDEPQGITLLQNLIKSYCPQLTLVGTADNAEKAYQLIKTTSPSIVLLDIEMPGDSGFQLLQKFSPVPFRVIFTTAHEKYAIHAIRFSAVDYLLKPISIAELKTAVAKAISEPWTPLQSGQINSIAAGIQSQKLSEKIALPVQDGIRFETIDEIIYCKGSNNYTYFYLRNGDKILVSRTLKEYEQLLTEHHFFRVHQSYLINLNYVKRYIRGRGGYVVMENNAELPVSTRKKEEFLAVTGCG
jgi:two-component system LytT family response regulator